MLKFTPTVRKTSPTLFDSQMIFFHLELPVIVFGFAIFQQRQCSRSLFRNCMLKIWVEPNEAHAVNTIDVCLMLASFLFGSPLLQDMLSFPFYMFLSGTCTPTVRYQRIWQMKWFLPPCLHVCAPRTTSWSLQTAMLAPLPQGPLQGRVL